MKADDAMPSPLTVWATGDQMWAEKVARILHSIPIPNTCQIATTSSPPSRPDFIIAMLSTSTWSRRRHLTSNGPAPVRNSTWPWGLPWLGDGDRDRVERDNAALRTAMSVMRTGLTINPGCDILMVFPEDLGQAPNGRPASIWQLEELRTWSREQHLLRGAFYQCELAASARPGPTGFLSSHRISHKAIRKGWPLFRGQANAKYLGPLHASCACGSPHHEAEQTDDAERFISDAALTEFLRISLISSQGANTELLRTGTAEVSNGTTKEPSETSNDTWCADIEDFEPNTSFGDFGDFVMDNTARKNLDTDDQRPSTLENKDTDRKDTVTQ